MTGHRESGILVPSGQLHGGFLISENGCVQAGNLKYIMEAPKLARGPDESVTLPVMETVSKYGPALDVIRPVGCRAVMRLYTVLPVLSTPSQLDSQIYLGSSPLVLFHLAFSQAMRGGSFELTGMLAHLRRPARRGTKPRMARTPSSRRGLSEEDLKAMNEKFWQELPLPPALKTPAAAWVIGLTALALALASVAYRDVFG